MKLRVLRPVTTCLVVLVGFCVQTLLPNCVQAQQTYTNIVNQRFHTVSNGPQSAIIVDVADPTDEAGVRRAVSARMAAVNQARLPALQREIAFMRKHHLLKPGQSLPLIDTVMIRSNGRLVLPDPKIIKRGPGGNTVTYTINTTAGSQYFFDTTNATTASAVNDLSTLVNSLLYPELVNVLGPPGWTGTVTILNKDDNPTLNSGIIGVTVVINGSTVTIDLPSAFAVPGLSQDEFLGMAQAMAQTFHGPLAIGYDAWEKGMARTAAVIAARDLQGKLPAGLTVDPSASFYYTPYYDLINQPALGNNTFLPPTQSSQTLSGLGGMIVPRLQASSSAWLKCYIENPGFFVNFNSAYYTAYAADPTVALDTTRLSALAGTAVGGSVEGQTFANWYPLQYVFDTSIIPGPKLFVYPIPTPPDATHTDDGVALVLLYYSTTGTGDETELNGTASPVYLDSTYVSRLTLDGGDPQVPITSGEGETGPYFTGIGNPQRVTIDIPVDSNYARIPYPALEATVGTGASLVYNDFFGVVVGSDTGNLSVSFNGGDGKAVTTPVSQGAFGALGSTHMPASGFTQAAFTYTPASGGTYTFRRNVYVRQDTAALAGVENIFVLTTPAITDTLTHTFQPYPQLISLPIQPLNPDLAAVFGLAPNQTLLAEYRTNAVGTTAAPNGYLNYPSLPLYQPGYALWSNFTGALNGVNITGQRTDNETVVEVSLQYGWNMIGNPFGYTSGTVQGINVQSDGTTGTAGGMTFQYLNGDTLDLADAQTQGWIGQGIFGYDGVTVTNTTASNSYIDITSTTNAIPAAFVANTLQPWQGYWILVTVTEGVTLSYVNPSPNTRAAYLKTKRGVTKALKPVSDPGAWRMPLMAQDSAGRTTYVTLGQSTRGADSYVSALDAAKPPAFVTSNVLGLRFPHPEWKSVAGADFLSDIRRTNTTTTWNVTMDLPETQQSYALAWTRTAVLPRNASLTLTDMTTGTKTFMNTTTRYAFTPNKGETSRNFQITLVPNSLSHIAVTNLRVDVPHIAGRAVTTATISYELTGAAETTVQISGGGRVVRHLVVGRAATAGVNQVVWDLRDDQGRGLASGTYLIEVQMRTADGRQTRATMPQIITR